MKFHEEWQHPECSTMEWLKPHASRRFKSIQHWQNVDTKFLHEFLIISFTDGSACRVERMGDGSRVDALLSMGCPAFDLIQWFSPEDHKAKAWSRKRSQQMIIEVDFPRTFELLDVLAICYTIQHRSRRTSVYTLLRFNCYFLCNTILAVLTRRLAEWETLTDADAATFADSMIDELKSLSMLPVEQQPPLFFFGVGICSLLDPDSPNPAGFLLEALRSELYDASDSLNEDLASALWYHTIDEAGINTWLFDCSCTVAKAMINDRTPSLPVQRLLSLLKAVDEGRYPLKGLDIPSIIKEVSGAVLRAAPKLAKYFVAGSTTNLERKLLERQPPLRLRVISSALGALICAVPTSIVPNRLSKRLHEDDEDEMDSFFNTFSVTAIHVLSKLPLATRSQLVKIALFDDWREEQEEDGGENWIDCAGTLFDLALAMCHELAEPIFRILLTILHPDSGLPNVPAALAFLNLYLRAYLWETCFAFGGHGSVKKHDFQSKLGDKTGTIVTRSGSDMQAMQTVGTVVEFQTYIRERIHIHAKTVESYKLAAAPVVQKDIELSMAHIWRSLPPGFGARKDSRER